MTERRRDVLKKVTLARDTSHLRGELADPALSEELEAADGEGVMRRREFLGRTAALAGAAGLASALPVDQLIAAAARRQVAKPYPSPRNMPIDTIVILMMENRSFDHYFGWREDADAKNSGLRYPDAAGKLIETYHLTPDYQGCGFRDPDHGWDGGRYQWGRGKMKGFVQGNENHTGSDEFAIGYYLAEDIPFLSAAADAFMTYDRYFCSVMASTFPNRLYQMSANGGGIRSNELPISTLGHPWESIIDRAKKKGVSIAFYSVDLPSASLFGSRGMSVTRPASQFYADAAAGLLPHICIVDPPFRDGGGGEGTSADDHPHGDIRLGQAYMSDIAHAFMESPHYARGAMFINYDEWGGFFDHVEPRRVIDDRNHRNPDKDWGLTGFRTPTVAISPYARKNGVSHATMTHESILKLISYRFGLGYLNKRHRFASDIGRTLDFSDRKPDPEPPELPDPNTIAAIPCFLQGGTQGELRAKEHDFAKLESSGYLDRLGYEIPKTTYSKVFRNPDSVKKALESSTHIVR